MTVAMPMTNQEVIVTVVLSASLAKKISRITYDPLLKKIVL